MTHNPYPGLRPFQPEDWRFFFGRERQTNELLDRLGQNHFLAVVGVSGSGKSSLIRAGLLPRLRRGFISETGSRWKTVILRPGDAPMNALWQSLTSQVIPKTLLPEELNKLSETFELSSRGLIKISAACLGKHPNGTYDENL